MSLRPAWICLLLLAACSAAPQGSATSPISAVRPPAELHHSQPATVQLPPAACSREGYEAFVEVFVRNPEARPSLALPGAPIARLDIAMRDYSWVLASNPDTLLDVDERRSGDALFVSAKPVERNDEDEVVKVLGPTRTYLFRYTDACWRFAAIK